MTILIEALSSENGKGYTCMSDEQKGLIKALENVGPKSFLRYYWRNLWSNLRKNNVNTFFWYAAKATTEVYF